MTKKVVSAETEEDGVRVARLQLLLLPNELIRSDETRKDRSVEEDVNKRIELRLVEKFGTISHWLREAQNSDEDFKERERIQSVYGELAR